ncbi:MAG: DUF2079 domain-containing protein [Anaerolineales bacterium]|nr:DUF2079 domain-containing protein [Anaerolineales bacterium]
MQKNAFTETRLARLLLALVMVWIIMMATFAIMRHQRFNSTAYDLAIYSQVIDNTANGRFFASTIEFDHSYLGDHVQPILLLLVPLYYLWANPQMLIIIQTIVLGISALPLYALAKHKLGDPRLAFLFALIYLLYPTVGFINRFDFHPIVFAIPFLLLTFLALEKEQMGWATAWAFLATISNDEIGLTICMVGIYAAIVKKRWRWGISVGLLALCWALLTQLVIIPAFRPEAPVGDTLLRYTWLGPTTTDQLRTLLTQPGMVLQRLITDPLRQQFLLRLLLPVGYLALLSPLSLLIGLPALAYNLLSDIPSQHSIYFHYVAPVLPIALIAAMEGAKRVETWLNGSILTTWPRLLTIWLLLGTAVAWMLDNPFTHAVDEPYYPVHTLQRYVDPKASAAAQKLIPPEASVAGMMTYLPHVSERPVVHLFYDRMRLTEWPYGFPQTDYAFLNLQDMRYWVNSRLFYAQIQTAIGHFGYEAIYFDQDVVLLARDIAPQAATGAVLQRALDLQEAGGKFAPTAAETLRWMGQQWLRETVPQTATPLAIQFDDGIILRGYEISANSSAAGRPLCATLYWEAQTNLENTYTVFLHFVDQSGYVHAQHDGSPAQTFYPTNEWQPGEIIADMHCLQIPPQLAAGRYALNLGMYEPNSGERLSILTATDQPAPGAMRLAEIEVKE